MIMRSGQKGFEKLNMCMKGRGQLTKHVEPTTIRGNKNDMPKFSRAKDIIPKMVGKASRGDLAKLRRSIGCYREATRSKESATGSQNLL